MAVLIVDERGIVGPCPDCGQKNRVPFEKLAETGACGKCGADLSAPAAPIAIPSETAFDHLIRRSALPVLVDFWAEWCPPCRALAPELEKAAASTAGRFVIAKLDTEAVPGVAMRYSIGGIPTLILFRAGGEIARITGARSAKSLEQWMMQAAGT